MPKLDDMNVSKKKMVADTILNIFAAALPIVMIQLFVFPILGRQNSTEEYALMVTVYAIMMLFPKTSGYALNNTRLVKNSEYIKNNIEGDFNYLLIKYTCFNGILLAILFVYYYRMSDLLGMSIALITALSVCINAYFEVTFSVKLQFTMRLMYKVCQSAGFAVGLGVALLTGKWEFVFLFGQVATTIMILLKSDMYKEKRIRTQFFKTTERDYLYLLAASLMGAGLDYADRLLLFPLMGERTVSIYYVASVMGKLILFIMPPVKMVILSYLSHIEKMKRKHILYVIGLGFAVCLLMYIACVVLAPFVLKILYPQYMDEALPLVAIVTITASISGFGGIIQAFVMRYSKMKWQLIIYSVSIAFYLATSLTLIQFWGVVGFCIGNAVGYFVKLVGFVIIFIKDTRGN